MKKYTKQIMSLALVATLLFSLSGCREDFAKLNQDPSTVTTGNPGFLFAQGILEFEPSDYVYWFMNANKFVQWNQTGVLFEGVTSTWADGSPAQRLWVIDVLRYANELKHVRSNMPEEESNRYQHYSACLDILCIYMGIFDSDFVGDIPYTEAAQAIHGGTLTPKYDRVEDLYNLWLTNLDDNIRILTTVTGQVFQPAQDPIYNGNRERWAKLANSLKLKIAARMINVDRARAIRIAEEVANSPVGVLNGEGDDFLFNKATQHSSNQNFVYHWNNGFFQSMAGSLTAINFMVDNKDPRVRFVYRKNSWNSRVVQAFFNAGRQESVPHYIMDNIDYVVDGSGVYQFRGWKGAGEPWVRYYGVPLTFEGRLNSAVYGDWFEYSTRCRLENIVFQPFSGYEFEMVHGRNIFNLPVAPGDSPIQTRDQTPWWGMYMTTAEVNLYLAEFRLLGAALPESAAQYFNRAIAASVREYDRLARNNRIPYYGTTYNYCPFERVIDLQSGEIEAMMSNPDYQLTGDPALDLEKVYIQQILHFSMQPIEAYITGLRSGVPIINSALFPRTDYAAHSIPTSLIPRRMAITAPSVTDLMFDVLTKSLSDQGYTPGGGTILNTERMWQDRNNPQWGAGPKM
ncbi:MAG: SusD/RagB family nutrient-binding outer membrane lipoprotein [Dysgonamonadaceae bacterium]|jgi:hypothetical protein|nr:SusD/RagB family nutrient-binding outer membrane lipoprotein [Dysgonamonadaceae bacterium]